MRVRWIFALTLICLAGVVGILIASCSYNGNVTINTKDSFRFISPDLELYPELHNSTTIDNDDDGNPDKEEEK